MMKIFDSTIAEFTVERTLNLFSLMESHFLMSKRKKRKLFKKIKQVRKFSSYLAILINETCTHIIAHEESLSLHYNIVWRLMSGSNIGRPNSDCLSAIYFNSTMEFEHGFIISTLTNQLPTTNLNFLFRLKRILLLN